MKAILQKTRQYFPSPRAQLVDRLRLFEQLDMLELPGVNLEEVAMYLTNNLVELSSPFLVVLDDFHNITNSLVCQAQDFFIDTQPPQTSLLPLSRVDPALQPARHRTNDHLIELRQDHLRFTLPEALSFLNQWMRLNLLPSQAEILESRPEEWIAGVQTAALSLQHTPDGDGGIRDFSGSQRFILDYLIVCIIVLIKGESYARQSSIVYFLYCQPRSTTGCMQFYWQLRPAHD